MAATSPKGPAAVESDASDPRPERIAGAATATAAEDEDLEEEYEEVEEEVYEEVEEEVEEEEQQQQPEERLEQEEKPSAQTDVGVSASTVPPNPPPAPAQQIFKWPGWPGDNVFRLVVPVNKVGSIIGRKGELIKKLCEETKARVRILEGPIGTVDRIVLISGKEEPDVETSPAVSAVIRVAISVNGISDNGTDGSNTVPNLPDISVRLLVPSVQAISLIGKKGEHIKSILEKTEASIRILMKGDLPFYVAEDERIVEIKGESSNLLKALKEVLQHLRKYLVDHTVIPLFEKNYASASQVRSVDSWDEKPQSLISAKQSVISDEYSLPSKQSSSFLDHDPQLDSQHSGLAMYGRDPAHSGIHSSGLGRSGTFVMQITQAMQVPLAYAEDIIGVGGENIAYIRRSSGAVITVTEARGLPDEIAIEIKGTASQVDRARQLIQDFISQHREAMTDAYGVRDPVFSSTAYPSSFHSEYSQSGLGGYGGYRY